MIESLSRTDSADPREWDHGEMTRQSAAWSSARGQWRRSAFVYYGGCCTSCTRGGDDDHARVRPRRARSRNANATMSAYRVRSRRLSAALCASFHHACPRLAVSLALPLSHSLSPSLLLLSLSLSFSLSLSLSLSLSSLPSGLRCFGSHGNPRKGNGD